MLPLAKGGIRHATPGKEKINHLIRIPSNQSAQWDTRIEGFFPLLNWLFWYPDGLGCFFGSSFGTLDALASTGATLGNIGDAASAGINEAVDSMNGEARVIFLKKSICENCPKRSKRSVRLIF